MGRIVGLAEEAPVRVGPTHRLRFAIVVSLPAAVLMALEITSSRLLAPVFGNSVYVWGSIIGVFLAAMSLGYLLGGWLADRWQRLSGLGLLLVAAAAAQIATGILGRWTVTSIGSATLGRPSGTLLATAVLFGPATCLLATVAPFAVRVASRDLVSLGGLAGRLYALSNFGSLSGTLVATFFLIPRFPVDAILWLLAILTAVASGAAIGRVVPTVGLSTLALLLWAAPRPAPAWDSVLVERASPYQTLIVRDSDGIRTLYSDGSIHGASETTGWTPTLPYVRAVESLRLYADRDPENVLLLGLGSGGIGRFIQSRYPGARLTYVDIDPSVVMIAREYFKFELKAGDEVFVGDARTFLAATDALWDWIICDTYVGHSLPFHLATREYFALAARRLAPGGALALNLASAIDRPFALALYRTVNQEFGHVDIYTVPGSRNHILVAQSGTAPTLEALRQNAEILDSGRSGKFSALVDLRISTGLDLTRATVLTDAFAPVDGLLDFSRQEIVSWGDASVR